MGKQIQYTGFLKYPLFFRSGQPVNFMVENKKLKDNCSDQ